MSKSIRVKVNAVYEDVIYLNTGSEESVKVQTSNFKAVPFKGEVLDLDGYSEFKMANRKGRYASFSNCKFVQRTTNPAEEFERKYNDEEKPVVNESAPF